MDRIITSFYNQEGDSQMDIETVKNVTIVGVGTQGAQIVFRSAIYGKYVTAYDISDEMLNKTDEKIKAWLGMYVKSGRLSDKDAKKSYERIKYSANLRESLENADLAIEVVSERLELKQKVWEEIDELAPEKTLLTSNSSSLKGTSIGKNVKRKDKTFNINFMTPVEDDLVEVMWNANTTEETKKAAMGYLNSLKLVPIVTKKEIKGFSHNRVWRAIKKETLKLWDQDYCDFEDLDRAFILEFGTKFGPFGLMDIVGLDVIRDIEISYYNESNDNSDKPPKKLLDKIAKGELGVKSGKGFYDYPNPKYTQPNWLRKE